ncbi:hypothetical protein AB0368_23550 [Actinoplanes sp. NPDC051475]|uniref:hypothetical protein n=1 Tax=Actinoplanes sp. NPDC051475 TaxID=3157225 RepID=UPI003450A15C
MASDESGFAALSRTVVSYAAELIAGVERRVVGEEKMRTARGNAWAAICADRARAQARADMDAMVAVLAAQPRRRNAGSDAAGSSPLSSVSPAALATSR